MMSVLFTAPETWLAELFFAMLRSGAAFLVSPVFSAMGIPVLVRIALSLGIGLLFFEQAIVTPPESLLSSTGFALALQELAIGLILGFILQLVFAAPVMAGEYMSSSMGLGFAAMVDPQSGISSPAISQFIMIYATLAFLAFDGHLMLIEAIARSYVALPVSGSVAFPQLAKQVLDFSQFIFVSAFGIALPVGICVVASNIVIAMMTRSAPQMNIFSIGMPLTVGIGLVSLAAFFPFLATLIDRSLGTGVTRLEHISTRQPEARP
jgi:flagellar biosynthesis protein FliR